MRPADRRACSFHPEVAHTNRGTPRSLSNFLFGVCGATPGTPAAFSSIRTLRRSRDRVGQSRVIAGLSGGVDSGRGGRARAPGGRDKLTCIFVDTGLLPSTRSAIKSSAHGSGGISTFRW